MPDTCCRSCGAELAPLGLCRRCGAIIRRGCAKCHTLAEDAHAGCNPSWRSRQTF